MANVKLRKNQHISIFPYSFEINSIVLLSNRCLFLQLQSNFMKFLFASLIAFFTFNLNAQTPKSIEITVTDTVELKTKSAVFIVTMEIPYSYGLENYEMESSYKEPEYYEIENLEEENFDEKSKKDRKKKKGKKEEAPIVIQNEEEPQLEYNYDAFNYEEKEKKQYLTRKSNLLLFLNANGIEMDSVHIPDPDFDLYENESFKLKITAKSWDEIQKVFNYCDTLEETEVEIHSSTTESLDEQYKVVYTRLFAKAKKEAAVVAEVIGLKLGGVTKVSNTESMFDPLFDLQNNLDKILRQNDDLNQLETQKKLVRRTFIFEVK